MPIERICWSPIRWWSSWNIWIEARVACISCDGWTYICQAYSSGYLLPPQLIEWLLETIVYLEKVCNAIKRISLLVVVSHHMQYNTIW